MTFTRSHSTILFDYNISGLTIERVDNLTDLGFKLTRNLSPSPHIAMITNRAFKVLGFIMRLSKDFKLSKSLKSLYCALVRPILEYGSVVWDPYTASDINQLERVQHRFLRFCCFVPLSYYIRFDNIVLISDCGTPYQLTLTDLEDRMIPKIAHFNYEYMVSMGFKSFVDVITGTVTAINKADKCVTVNEDEQVYYDYLFLFYGEQFGYTAKENEIKSKNSIESNDETNILENLFFLNSEHDVTHIIVLGKYLGSLTVINALLESNIQGPRIVYIETYEKKNIPFITNKFIKNAVYNELYSQGVRVYKKCVFEKFTLNRDRTHIRKVTFTATGDILLTLDCATLFWFDQKFTNKVNWFTMLQSALKFDGHLVVNTSFETNIEFVYAAGPMARFMHNKYFVLSHHMYYNRLEIGDRVANVLMKRLGIVDDDKSNDDYVRPLFVYCQFPGKYNYLHTEVPVWRSLKKNSKTLSTGNATDGYFEIIVDSNGDVLELSCYSNKDIKYLNLINLCGKHVNLFNDMMYRFKMDSIPCFFEYFNQSWSYPLYSDRFWKMLNEMKLKRDNKISRLARSPYLDNRFDQLYGEKLNAALMNFVANNVDDFPMFSHTIDQRETEDEYNTV
ncbi:cilia- and flagella-associated protein 61-like [Melanaphis sacchari]|uniref:cilia- and flagella-associated protein 61-like n=1 Tax=Melanaphis sacchari TaxID=742174 RepID=UPI000DC12D67|nr:cilia- and flagella-associated protein 61-like [Melanaphis sacchari]